MTATFSVILNWCKKKIPHVEIKQKKMYHIGVGREGVG